MVAPESIASRVSQRKRRGVWSPGRCLWGRVREQLSEDTAPSNTTTTSSSRRRRRLDSSSPAEGGGGDVRQAAYTSKPSATRSTPPSSSPSRRHRRPSQRDADVASIRAKFGNYQHHGTGNPLAVRSPTTPKTLGVENLATIIQDGVLGRTSASDSTPRLKTERGKDGSFWTNRIELAGKYGWTGLVLPQDVDTSRPLPVEDVVWFVVEDEDERTMLKSLLLASSGPDRWEAVRDRVVTIGQLAESSK